MRLAIGRASYYVFAGGLAIMFLIPLVWTAVASVSPHGATAQQEGYGFGNYQMLVDYDAGLLRYLWNSSVVSALTVVFTLVLSILGGYAFARFRFWGRDTLFLLVIAILMVPYVTLLVPLWVLFGEIGLRNNLLGLAIVMTLYQLPFAMFMMRVSFEAVPRELEESALVDGCGVRGTALDPAARGLAGHHHRRPVRLPERLERLHRPAVPHQRQCEVSAAAGDRHAAGRNGERGQLRGHRGRRRRDGDPVPDPVPASAAPLRSGLHVGGSERMSSPHRVGQRGRSGRFRDPWQRVTAVAAPTISTRAFRQARRSWCGGADLRRRLVRIRPHACAHDLEEGLGPVRGVEVEVK